MTPNSSRTAKSQKKPCRQPSPPVPWWPPGCQPRAAVSPGHLVASCAPEKHLAPRGTPQELPPVFPAAGCCFPPPVPFCLPEAFPPSCQGRVCGQCPLSASRVSKSWAEGEVSPLNWAPIKPCPGPAALPPLAAGHCLVKLSFQISVLCVVFFPFCFSGRESSRSSDTPRRQENSCPGWGHLGTWAGDAGPALSGPKFFQVLLWLTQG